MKLFKAFTLVELLVVMAIISFLSVGAFAGLSYGLRQARDVQKKKIVDLANTALQAYYSDYSTYPSCNPASNKGTLTPAVTGWSFCNQAFPNNSTGGYLITQGAGVGLKDYLEGEWPMTNANAQAGASDEYLRYYTVATGSALKFAVCTTVENKTSTSNLVRKGTTIKDCYCAGTEYSDVACAGMSAR